jgi:hypothetical protein
MSEQVQRYRIDEDGLLDEHPAGLIVTYPDHLDALKAAREERDKEFNAGWDAALEEVSLRVSAGIDAMETVRALMKSGGDTE